MTKPIRVQTCALLVDCKHVCSHQVSCTLIEIKPVYVFTTVRESFRFLHILLYDENTVPI